MALGKSLEKGKNASKKKDEVQLSIDDTQELDVMNLEVDKVHPDPDQPRKSFNTEAFFTLKAQIKATNGCRQPIKVKPHPSIIGEFMIKFGERRWRSHKDLGYTTIPAILDTNEESVFATRLEQVIENVGRDDLTRFDEAVSYRNLIDIANLDENREKKYTQKDLAETLGYKAPYLSQIMAILKAPESVQSLSTDGVTQNVNVFACLTKLSKKMPENEFDQLVSDVRSGNVNDKELQVLLSELNAPENTTDNIGDDDNSTTSEHDDSALNDPLNSVLNNSGESNDSGEEANPNNKSDVDYGFYDYQNVYEKAIFDALFKRDLAFEINEAQKDEVVDKLETVTNEWESGDHDGQKHSLKELLSLFKTAIGKEEDPIKTLMNVRLVRKMFHNAMRDKNHSRDLLQDCNSYVSMESFEVVDGQVLIYSTDQKPILLSKDDIKQLVESV